LFNGTFSYHRVVSVQLTPWRYVEFGWIKEIIGQCGAVAVNNNCGLIVYDAGNGVFRHAIAITRANHVYASQYDPNTNKHWFFLDNANVWNVQANFGQGTDVWGGGEVGAGVEQMKDVQLADLRYIMQNGGIFQSVSWNGYVNHLQEAPYSNIAGGPNDFFDHGP
jgi:hypothetical protein